MTGCANHLQYLGALADGEVRLVPEETRRHVAECDSCSAEVATQQLLTERVRQTTETAAGGVHAEPRGLADRLRAPAGPRRVRVGMVKVAAGALLMMMVAAAASFGGWNYLSEQRIMAAAARAGMAAPQFVSDDPTAVTSWCVQHSGRAMPSMTLVGFTPMGARMDSADGREIVTIRYITSGGQHVAVSWLDSMGYAPRQTTAEAHAVDGRTLLLVHTTSGGAVVSGDAPPSVLWSVAGEIEAKVG